MNAFFPLIYGRVTKDSQTSEISLDPLEFIQMRYKSISVGPKENKPWWRRFRRSF